MINYYYVLYIKRKDNIEIHAIPFDSREEAAAYKESADKYFKELGQYEFSRILRKDMSKVKNQYWL